MSSVRRLLIIGVLMLAVSTLCNLLPAHGQGGAREKPLMAEDVFKNVQVLKGIPVNQFMETMGFFSAALGYNCTNCHGDEVLGNWEKYAVDIPLKRTARGMIPLEVYANATGQRTLIAYTQNGDSVTAYDGHNAWIVGPDKPVSVLQLVPGGDLDGIQLDSDLAFPGRLKQALTDWRTGFPTTIINDRSVQVVQAMAGGSRVKLFFDKETALLTRVVRYSKTVVGAVPIQIDYSDYREVAGVKMPFQWRLTWTDGQSTYKLDEVQPNVTIDPAKFARPLAPAAPVVAPAKVAR